MPVLTGAIVNSLEDIFETGIRIVRSFASKVRLYPLQPKFKFPGEWSRVESCLLKARFIDTDGELQSICGGGWLGTLYEGDCLPDCSIQSSSQLIKELAKFERNIVARGDGRY